MNGEMAVMFQTWGPILVMVAIFYFLLYRPQKAEQKRRKAMLDSLKEGDRVVTIGGIYGILTEVREKTVNMKIADNTEIEVARAAINGNVSQEENDG